MITKIPTSREANSACSPIKFIFLSFILLLLTGFSTGVFGQSNDCANATPLSISPYGECGSNAVAGTNADATDTGGAPDCDTFGGPWPDVFYSFNSGPYSTLDLTFTPGTITDRVVEVLEGCDGTIIFCDITVSSGFLTVTPNTDYILRISSNQTYGDPGTFTVCVSAPEPPACINPVLTTYAFAIGTGGSTAIEGCIASDSLYNIALFINDDFGNTSYYLTYGDGEPVFFDPTLGYGIGYGAFLGPVQITATGVENNSCATTLTFSPEYCAPSNDSCANATNIIVDGPARNGINTAATGSPEIPVDCGGFGDFSSAHDVWYSFVAPVSGIITLETFAGTLTDTQMQVFDGCGGEVIGCNDDKTSNDFMSKIILSCDDYTPGQTYYVQVDGYSTNMGTFTISITTAPCPVPPNDNCDDAIVLTVNAGGDCDGNAVSGTTSGASIDILSGCNASDVEQSVYYSFNSGENTAITLTINSYTAVGLFYGVSEESCDGTLQACDFATVPANFLVTPNTNYIVRLAAYANPGSFDICVSTGYCPDLSADIGSACDDGDPSTSNDVIHEDCTCIGSPSNNDCASAIDIQVDAAPLEGTNLGATPGSVLSIECGVAGETEIQNDVWFSFVAPSSGLLTIETFAGSNTDTQIQIFDGCGGNVVACDDDGGDTYMSKTTIGCGLYTPGDTYYVEVDGWNGTAGTFGISVTTSPCPPPANDNCEAAISTVCGNTYSGTTMGATATEGQSYCDVDMPDPINGGVWYQYTATENGSVNFEFTNTSIGYNAFIYSGACDNLNCEMWMTTLYQSSMTADFSAGMTYYIYVTGTFAGESGNFDLTVTCLDPPNNDDCSNAYYISCGETYTWNTLSATSDNDQVYCGPGGFINALNGGVWYSYTTVEAETVIFSLSNSDFNNLLFLYSGSCDALICEAGDNDGPEDDSDDAQITADLGANQTYYLYVTGVFSERGNFDLNVQCSYCPDLNAFVGDACDDGNPLTSNDSVTADCVCAGTYSVPPNDVCTDAENLTVNLPGACTTDNQVLGTTNGALSDIQGGSCDNGIFNLGVFYAFNSGDYNQIILNFEDLTITDWVITVYEGCGGSPVTCTVDGVTLSVPTTVNTDYVFNIATNPNYGETGTFNICLEGVYNCPELNANIGDACDDGNPNTSNDLVTADCTCEGTVVYDCPDLNANIGDSCDDGNPLTENDVIIEGCTCQGTPPNDACADAETLIVNAPGNCLGNETLGTTTNAAPTPGANCEAFGPDVYYSFNAGTYENVIINLSAVTATDLVISVLEGGCGSTAIYSCYVGNEQNLDINVTPGETYYVRIHSYGDIYSGDFNICIEGVSSGEGTLIGTIAGWNGACGDRAVIVSLSDLTVGTFYGDLPGVLHADGSFELTPSVDIIPGTYMILVKVSGALAIAQEDVLIAAGSNTIDVPAVKLGDINNDNFVNFVDVSILNAAFGSATGDGNFNSAADLNCDGFVNFVDVSILNSNFGQEGDAIIIVD